MKRVFAFFFCAMLAGQAWAQSFQSGSLWYRIDDQEARTVTVINDESYYYLTQVVIPETVSYNGIDYSVTSISPNAFYGYTKIHSVDIPKTITNIGDDAFAGCSNVAILSYNTHAVYDAIWQVEDFLGGVIGQMIQINRPMLSCMVSLETVNIGDAVTIIPDGCFSGKDLRNVIIPNSVTSIGNNAFGNCLSLKYLDIPESVTSIGTDAFFGIDVVSYSGTAEGCPWGAESIAEGDFVYYDCEKKTLKSYIGKGGHVVIPDNVTSIGENAFPSYDIYYSLIEIPETVTSIEPDAFSNVGPIFYSGSAAGSPWGASGIEYYKDGDFLFYDEQLTQIKSYIGNGGEVVIPSTVTSIGDHVFSCCRLTSLSIPESVILISENAFDECSIETLSFNTDAANTLFDFLHSGYYSFNQHSIKNIHIGNRVTHLVDYAFYEIDQLESVTIESDADVSNAQLYFTRDGVNYKVLSKMTVETVGGESNTVTLVIPAEVTAGNTYMVTNIKNSAFSSFNNLTTITIETDADVSNAGLSFKKDGIRYKVLSRNSVEIVGNKYSSTPEEYGGKPDDGKPNDDDSGNSSGDDDLTNITELVIPATVTAGSTFTIVGIAENAFKNYTNLTSITIETDVDVSNAGLSFKKDGISYGVLSKNTAVLTSCKNLSGDVAIQNDIIAGNTFKVTKIGNEAFRNCSGLTSVTIPNSVTTIGDEAFRGCSGMTSVSIGNSVTKIGNGAFQNCSGLTSITIPESVTSIDNYAFAASGLTSVTIPESVAHIDRFAFGNYESASLFGEEYSKRFCPLETLSYNTDAVGQQFMRMPTLKTVNIGDKVTRITDNAFMYCYGLRTVTIGNSVTSIGYEAFSGCNLTSLTIPESVTDIEREVFVYCTVETLTYNTNAIGSQFASKSSLKTVNIGDKVTEIADNAFSNCNNLTSITIPESVTSVGRDAFFGCGLTSVVIETDADVSNAGLCLTKDDIGYGVLSKNSAQLANGQNLSGEFVVPAEVTAGNTFTIKGIGERAFADNTNITSITLPEYVTNIGNGAFSGCNNLETLTYNTNAVGTMFSGMQSLKTVNIGDAVTRLEDGAFARCKYLENVNVGNGIESVGNNVFDGCNFLDYNIYSNGYYLGNSQNPNMILMSARNKSITSCTVSADCRFICDGAFRDCKRLAEVVLPESLTYVNNGLFSGCGSLRSVAIPESVKAIGNDAFKGCSSLAEIKIPESVTTIGSNAFAGCSGITALTIPNRVTSVSNNAFDGCTSLETVVIGKSVAEFSSGIFANCSGLDRIICYAETPIRLEDDPFIFSDTIYVPATSVDAYKAATIWKRKDIMPFYKVKILSANEALGTAEGDTLILGNHAATLTATPVEGYHFARWSDNNTESPRALAATKDTVLTAFFEAHTSVTDLAVAATCEAFGLTEGSHCPGCGHVFVKQDTLPATGHSEVVDVAVAPTCTVKGKTEGSHCSVCNAVLVAQNDIAALGHKEVADAAVAPTCTKTGLTAGKHCMVCEAVTVAQAVVPALGHKEVVDAAVAPTCTESGLTEGKHCSVCDAVIVAQKMVLALGHKEVIDAGKAATCTESGKTEGKHCSVCNAVLKEQTEIAALGHVEVVDAAIQATCTEPGLTEGKHCSVCRHVLKAQEVVPAMGHTVVVDSAVAPACTEPGLTEGSHCSVCNAVIVPQVKIPMLKHDIVLDTAVAATATTDGLTEGLHCSICGEVFRAQRVIPALGEQPGENENQGGNEQGNENQGGNENQEGNENQNTNPGTAVSEQIAELCVHAHHNIIVVENADAEIRVYDAMGRLVGRDAINRIRAEIRVKAAGIYIVRVGSVAKRVMIND